MRKWQLIPAIVLAGLGLVSPRMADAQGLPGGFVFLRDIEPGIIQDMSNLENARFPTSPPLRTWDFKETALVGLIAYAVYGLTACNWRHRSRR